MGKKENKKVEEMLRESEEHYRVFAAYQEAISELRKFYVIDAPIEQMVQKLLDLIVEKFGFYMAWYAELIEEEKVILPKLWAGKYEKYLDGLRLEFESDKRDAKCAMSLAILTKKPFGYADLEHDKDFEKWRAFALQYGYRSNQAIPFIVDGKSKSAFLIYSTRPFAFNNKLVEYLKGIVNELATITENITKRKELINELKEARSKLEKDKKILSEKVTKLTKKIPLTKNEKLVFYGLVKYPLLNDQQLSEKLNVKRSTITAVKNKLKILGFYSTCIIPNFESIGCELMCIIGGKAPIENIEERKRSDMIARIISSPEVVYYTATDEDCLGIIVSKTFVETKMLLEYVSSVYEQNNNEMPNPVYFPFAMSKIVNLFDYSALLKSLFNLNVKEETDKTIKPSKRELTNNEKLVLYTLTKYPDLTDTEVAAKTKISRQTVSQIKNNLIVENFLKIANLPAVKKLECELMLYSKGKINSKKIRKQEKMPSLIFAVRSEREGSGIFIFESYTKYKIEYDKLTSPLKKGQVIVGDPTMHLFPVQGIKFQKIDFAPLVKKIFALKTDF